MSGLSTVQKEMKSSAVLSISGKYLAYANGNVTRSFDLSKLISVYLWSGEFISPDTYCLYFGCNKLTISSDDEGYETIHNFILTLPKIDLDAVDKFNRCATSQGFDVWQKSECKI